MNNIICTFVQNQNKNINNWCKYYLNLGFDNIYIYNKNDGPSDYIGDFINDKIKSKVHILNLNNKKVDKNKTSDIEISFKSNNNGTEYINHYIIKTILN